MTSDAVTTVVIGESNGPAGAIARLLASREWSVILFDLGDPDSAADDQDHPTNSPYPGLVSVSESAGRSLREVFAEDDNACRWVLREANRRYQTVGAVVLAGWHATLGNRNGAQMLRALPAGTQVIAIEGAAAGSDQVVRWMHLWYSQLRDRDVTLFTLRRPAVQPAGVTTATDRTDVIGLLTAAGYRALTVDEIDGHAANQRATAADPLAGRMWQEAGITEISRGIAAFTATRVEPSWPPPVSVDPAGVWDLSAAGQPSILVEFENSYYGIDITPPGQLPDGIRLADTDAFETDGHWGHLSNLDLTDGHLYIGGWETFTHSNPWQVRPGWYAIERWHGTSSALRARKLPH